jgi:hypothetical protein
MVIEARAGNLTPNDIPPRVSPEAKRKILNGLDTVADVAPRGVFIGGLAVSIRGFLRRNPDAVARGLGIAAAGLILQNVHNPAQLAVGVEIGKIEDALDIV